MSNTELTKYYMALSPVNNKMPETPYMNIIPALDSHFGGRWTWELADERFAMDNTSVCTTITLYTPGRIYTGRSLCKIKDYHENHLFAILDACKSFMEEKKATQVQPNSNPANQQMTPDQIMNALGQQPQQQVNTAAQFYNYKDEQGMPAAGVPFEAITDNCQKELQQEFMNQPALQNPTPIQQTQQNDVDYNAPQAKYKGFSQCQIDRLNKFKKDFDILNDQMFGNYVHTWDKSLTSKADINPSNANAFLDWAENLGKMGC